LSGLQTRDAFGEFQRVKTFGISVDPSRPIQDALKFSTLAERLDFANVWVPDSGPIPPFGDTIVTLAAIASSTSKINFGSAILNFYTRNPAWIASSFLALSDAGRHKSAKSQRAILGIGVGSDWNVGKLGISNRKGMIDQLREAVESIRELFNGKLVDIRTESFVIEDVVLSKSRAKIPIFIGSHSPKGLELAGEIADGAILVDRIPVDQEKSLNSIALGLERASRRRNEFSVANSVVVSISKDKQKARRAVATTCSYLVSWLTDEAARTNEISMEAKAKITQFLTSGDEKSATKLVDNKMIDLLTVTGDVEECIEKCARYLSYDINQIVFCEPFGPDPKESIELLARKVIPRL
jgi:5,10-methylenetetrahydromethanopterin reductase